jgi:hypothetical protein
VIYSLLMAIGMIVALALGLLLLSLAALHVYWGRGGLWPAEDEYSLARQVVGAPGIQTMPSPAACYAVGALLLFAGLWPLTTVGILPALFPAELMVLAGYGLAAIFLARGAGAYLDSFRQFFPEEPFASLDRRLYGPLCLFIGTGFAFLIVIGWIAP